VSRAGSADTVVGAGHSPSWRAPLPLAIAWRYLRGSGSQLLSGTARAAIAATTIGVAAMVIAMALMSGYRQDLQRKLIGGNAAVVVYPLGGEELQPATAARLAQLAGVLGVSAVSYGQGTIASAPTPQGLEVTVRGVEPSAASTAATAATDASEPAAASLAQALATHGPAAAASGAAGPPWVALGADLAERLRIEVGAPLRLTVLAFREGRPRFSYATVRYAGSFHTGFSEFDRSWVVVDQSRLAATLGDLGGALWELRIADPARAPEVATAAEQLLGEHFLVSDWQDLNRELFAALAVQQWALFLMLGLIVLVSTFNVASTLVVLVRERRREIGVLAAMGFRPAALRRLFVLYGTVLGGIGIFLGVAGGGLAAWLLDTFRWIRFDAEVAAIYFISSVPFRLQARDLAAIVAFALVINGMACWIPAWRAARLDPAAALRYE
jgi:lipoprotein-releasing system permease protein